MELKKIQKKDHIDLLKCESVKEFIKENKIYLTRYQINCPIKKDEDFFYFEALIQTLKNKECFEGAFVKAYDDMIDYWQTLNYEERKRMINAEMDKIKPSLIYVERADKRCYVPCMNDKLNAIYDQEMVLFELKQYNKLRFECKEWIELDHITYELVNAHFTSLMLVKGTCEDYWAFCMLNHTLYHFIDDHIVDSFPFVQFQQDVRILSAWIEAYEKEDEDECLEMLSDHNWISDKMHKKLKKELERRKK